MREIPVNGYNPMKPPAPATAILLLIITCSAALRFYSLDLMEFKHDEVAALQLAEKFIATGKPPLKGLVSSIGIPNPPLFIYLLVPWHYLAGSPVNTACMFALAGTLSVILLAYIALQHAGVWQACVCAGLAGAAPWSVIFSRKIWSVDLSPLLVIMLMLLCLRLAARPGSRMVAALPGLLTLNLCLHFSGVPVCIAAVIALLLLVDLRALRWKFILAGIAPAILVILPYLLHIFRSRGADFARIMAATGKGGGFAGSLWQSIACTGNVVFAGRIDQLTGHDFAASHPGLCAITSALSTAGTVMVWAGAAYLLATICGHNPTSRLRTRMRERPLAVVTLAFLLTPVAVYGLGRIRVHNHYFIISMPAVFLCTTMAATDLSIYLRKAKHATMARTWSALWIIAVTTFMLAGSWWLVAFMGHVQKTGGTRGDYGEAFRFQSQTAEYMAGRIGNNTDVALLGLRDAGAGLQYLVWRELDREPRPGSRKPLQRIIILNLLTRRLPDRVKPDKVIGPYAVVNR